MSKVKNKKINGVLLLDKPIGLSSNKALQKARYLFAAEKAGHAGTLDPLASGLLPVFFGEATKFSRFLLDADKLYITKARLGACTTTGDREGELIASCADTQISERQLEKTLATFRGEIEQVPSMYSAIKHQGQPLYKLARQGIEVHREPRKVIIYRLEVVDFRKGELELLVQCSKGTYIRTLVEDIGQALGCGAFVDSLRRLHTGPFHAGEMITLDTIEKVAATGGEQGLQALLLPVDAAVAGWPSVFLGEDESQALLHGQVISGSSQRNESAHGLVRLMAQGQFVGIGEILTDGRIVPKRLLSQSSQVVDAEKVTHLPARTLEDTAEGLLEKKLVSLGEHG